MTAVDPPGRPLAKGDQNDHVHALQQLLGHLGLYQGEPDGYFGDALEDAVRQFQRAFGHDEDGPAGATGCGTRSRRTSRSTATRPRRRRWRTRWPRRVPRWIW